MANSWVSIKDNILSRPSPYSAGSCLQLHFTPEGSQPSYSLPVTVLTPFTPFTQSQALLAKLANRNTAARVNLPQKFVIKLLDRGFHKRSEDKPAWSSSVENQLKKVGIPKLKAGTYPNYWASLGGTRDQRVFPEDEAWESWMQEVTEWDWMTQCYRTEVAAYRQLRPLQGVSIPRFYGTLTYSLLHGEEPLHPITDYVEGLVLEYIDGVNMEKFCVGTDITKDDAERVSQTVLGIMRQIQKLKVAHNDVGCRNIILRHNDYDHPVLIDFGVALVADSGVSDEKWAVTTQSICEISAMRVTLALDGWHLPSPLALTEFSPDPLTGWKYMNGYIDGIRPKWRDPFYEPILINGPDHRIVIDEDGCQHRWDFPRWKMRPGVRSRVGIDS